MLAGRNGAESARKNTNGGRDEAGARPKGAKKQEKPKAKAKSTKRR